MCNNHINIAPVERVIHQIFPLQIYNITHLLVERQEHSGGERWSSVNVPNLCQHKSTSLHNDQAASDMICLIGLICYSDLLFAVPYTAHIAT